MGNEYEDMRMELNEMVIATNVTYEYCSIEDKPTCPWNKLHNSLYHEIDRLFLCFKMPVNQSLLRLRVVLRLDFLRRRPVKGFLMMNQLECNSTHSYYAARNLESLIVKKYNLNLN